MEKPRGLWWTVTLRSKEWSKYNGYYYSSDVVVRDTDPDKAYGKLPSIVGDIPEVFHGGMLRMIKWRIGKHDDSTIVRAYDIKELGDTLPATFDKMLAVAKKNNR